MVRSMCLLVVSLTLTVLCDAQSNPLLHEPTISQADSLKKLISITGNDTVRMAAFRDLAFYYIDENTDSALYFILKEIPIAQTLGLKMWEAEAKDLYSIMVANKGNYAGSLEIIKEAFSMLESKQIALKTWRLKNFSTMGTPQAAISSLSVLFQLDLSNLYKNTGDYKKYMAVATECRSDAAAINDQSVLAIVSENIGNVYQELKQFDSAEAYYADAVKYARASNYFQYISGAYNGLGHLYYLRQNIPQAKTYFYKALASAVEQQNYSEAGESTAYIAKILNSEGQLDSAFYYAKESIRFYRILHRDPLLVLSYQTMAEVFNAGRQYDSAYYYLAMGDALRDSTQLTENNRRFQSLEFNEQIKQQEISNEKEKSMARLRTYGLVAGLILIVTIATVLFFTNKRTRRSNLLLKNTLYDLKNTQSQLIQSEKMASLGELTAGIAHEIQNPLNFVNNFSEVSKELLDEMKDALESNNKHEVKELASDIIQNLEKISFHGKRADAIVKGMLQHSRASAGKKEPTDINGLCDEYLRLAYHGLRAKEKSFNATLETDYDDTIGKINIIPPDIGRVILNLITNAFYAVNEKAKQGLKNYQPTVSVSTQKENDSISISVKDNGNGIPQNIIDKIFQPFFTTKPTGEGTGLGLSLSYDIMKAHGGDLKVETKEKEGASFLIIIPA